MILVLYYEGDVFKLIFFLFSFRVVPSYIPKEEKSDKTAWGTNLLLSVLS
jgi:hypothetical protein